MNRLGLVSALHPIHCRVYEWLLHSVEPEFDHVSNAGYLVMESFGSGLRRCSPGVPSIHKSSFGPIPAGHSWWISRGHGPPRDWAQSKWLVVSDHQARRIAPAL